LEERIVHVLDHAEPRHDLLDALAESPDAPPAGRVARREVLPGHHVERLARLKEPANDRLALCVLMTDELRRPNMVTPPG
jgi:hypothetical protein